MVDCHISPYICLYYKPYAMVSHSNRLMEMVLMRSHTIYFRWENMEIYLQTRHRKRYNPLALYHSSYWSHC